MCVFGNKLRYANTGQNVCNVKVTLKGYIDGVKFVGCVKRAVHIGHKVFIL